MAGCVIESVKGSNNAQYEKKLKGLNREHPHWPVIGAVSHIHQVFCGLVDRQTCFTSFPYLRAVILVAKILFEVLLLFPCVPTPSVIQR